jgi:hypothetical protein
VFLVQGIDYNGTFEVMGFLDCSMFETDPPGTGPVDHYMGAPRRPEHDANGFSVMHGPHSARENDLGSVNISGLDNYLTNIQAGQHIRYKTYGDGIFKRIARVDNCIRSYHEARPLIPKTEFQVHENRVMKKMRIFVEHTYADLEKRFDIVNRKNEWKWMNLTLNHPAKLRTVFFFNNCLTCSHGNSLSKQYKIRPPTLAEFLQWPHVDE